MDEGIVAAVEDWDTRPFDGGARQLQELAERGFSGAVSADSNWLLLINGRAVGIFEEYDGPDGPVQEPGDVDRLADSAGTVYEAPHEALPLLFAMVFTDGTERGRYYTGDRPLHEAHRELEDGGFTGFIELSEEVLSGDYYVVYQGGRSMSVGFLGGERRLRTGDEAFDRADEEVGIYRVVAVDVDVIDLPEPPDAHDGAGAAAGSEEFDAGATRAQSRSGADPANIEDAEAAGTEPIESSDRTDGTANSAGQAEPADEDVVEASEPESREDDTDEPSSASSPADPDGQTNGDAEAAGTQSPSSEGAHSEPAQPAADLARLEARIDTLAAEQERLAAAVESLQSGPDGPVTANPSSEADTTLESDTALDETTVLVRYRADGGPRLEDVFTGAASRDDLQGNLQLEIRTPFDPETATVAGQAYRPYLESTLPYRFVEWLVSELPFDIRAAGAETALGGLYEALPEIDRVTFGRAASLEDESFDLVASNREGSPLVVATFEAGVEPPAEEATETFITAATRVAETQHSLAAAALVTSAFVDAAALGPAREATRSRLLGRGKRKSFVNLSGSGYHLCLVEAGDSFHLARPEL